jgi:alcohol dehydrogenase
MKRIQFYNPDKIAFGIGSLDQFITDFLGLSHKKLYLITIQPMVANLNEMLVRFGAAGILTVVNTSIRDEPSFDDFARLLGEARDFDADSVLGIGGGSVMDTAKLVAALLNSDQAVSDVLVNGFRKARQTYLACIPTTSGTGSEVSPNAIFVNSQGVKTGVISQNLVPDGVYVDPSLTFTVPPELTAATGIDALAHCIEAYTNKFAHPLTDLIALEGIRLIGGSLKRAYTNGSDVDARSNVALGSMYGGMCLGPVNTAAVHALAYPLSKEFHIPHGLSVALLLPYVMEFNVPSAPERYAAVAIALGFSGNSTVPEAATAGVDLVRNLILDCGLPSGLGEVQIPYEAVESMAASALQIQRLLKNNPRELSVTDAENIYRAAFNAEIHE